LDLDFTGDLWQWRGPSSYYFVTVPDDESALLHALSPTVIYGWGMIPVRARIGSTERQTSLFPKDGLFVVPINDAVRLAERIDDGDTITLRLPVNAR
jgi:hypothetical protein